MIIYIYLLVFHLFGTPVDSKEVKTTFGTYINKNFNFLLNHLNLQKLSVSESNILPHVLPSLSSNQIHSAGSVTGFLQAIYYPNDVACSKTNGAYTLDLAIGTCLPVKNILNTIANSYILLDDGSGGINAYLFSDTKCRTTAGIPVSVPSSTFKVCTDGVKYLLTTGSSPPPPPFTSQSYGSIIYYESICSSTVIAAYQEVLNSTCIAPIGCLSTSALTNTEVPVPFSTVLNLTSSCVGEPSSNGQLSSGPLSCFGAHEQVSLSFGDVKGIAYVDIDEEIAVAAMDGTFAGYSPIIAIPHDFNTIKTTFVQIYTMSQHHVRMTPDHLVLGGACNTDLSLVQADSLKVGDCVYTLSGAEAVTSVSTVIAEGVYTVVTKHDGLLIVGGIVVSPFAVNHVVANSFYNILRFMNYYVPWLSKSSLFYRSIEEFGNLATNRTSVMSQDTRNQMVDSLPG